MTTFYFSNGSYANNIPDFVTIFRGLSFDIIEHHYNHFIPWFSNNIKDQTIIAEIKELYDKNLLTDISTGAVINLFRTNLLNILYRHFDIVPIWTISDAPF